MSLSQAMTFTLGAEGRYSRDAGGTMYGVTQDVYDDYRESVGLPYQDVAAIRMSEVQAIMQRDYWLPGACDKMPARLGIAHFDWCYNHGVLHASMMLQRVLGVIVDGVIGPKTLQAIFASEQDNLLENYLNARREWYREDTTKPEDHQGWLNRVDALEKYLRTI